MHCLIYSFLPTCIIADALLQVKALVGAVGTLLYVHTPSNQVYVANIGSVAPFLTRSQGEPQTPGSTVQVVAFDH
jgi:hypothetical protein